MYEAIAAAIKAAVAMQNGLINHAVPSGELLSHAIGRATQLAKKPTRAMIETKRLMKPYDHAQIKKCLPDEAKVFGKLLTGDESKLARKTALKT